MSETQEAEPTQPERLTAETAYQKFSVESTRPKPTFTRTLLETYEKYNSLSVLIAIVSVATILFIAADECRQCFAKVDDASSQKKFWAYGKNIESGYLSNVFTVLDRFGYKNVPENNDWDLLWAHDYPFRKLYPQLNNLKPHQKVNHLPGCGYVTNKVDLATSGLKYIPPAFKLPEDKQKLLDHAKANPEVKFVQKKNDHRDIKIADITGIDLEKEGTFIQEYVDKPLLVSGHKFDIGIYTIVTSIDPLRIYIYNGEALLRFCPVKYYPFDAKNLDKYVVGDDYLPTWEVPALDYFYNELGFNMKESLNAYIRTKNQDPNKIWNQIEDSIRTVFLAKEPLILDVVNRFKSKRNFFEMMRFDFVLDEELNVYLLEANMSPNLSSAHFPPNQLMYQQVLYNILNLIGIGETIQKNTLAYRSKQEEQMVVSDKDIATYPKECSSKMCQASCVSPICQLCKPCLSPDSRENLVQAFREYVHKGLCRRVFPPQMTKEDALKPVPEDLSSENQLIYRWFQGKCLLDSSWC